MTSKITIEDKINRIPIKNIKPDLNQPRKYFDVETLRKLKCSIELESLHNPILVRRDEFNEDKFVVVDGQWRWLACLELNHTEIESRIVESDAHGYQILALTQNLHRDD